MERFHSKVNKCSETGCWLWTGSRSANGYGRIGFKIGGKWIPRGAHRVAWVLHHGKQIPKGMEVCHTCDRPECVNPDHLKLGTHADNMGDMKSKNRRKGIPATWKRQTTDEQIQQVLDSDPTVSANALSKSIGVPGCTILRIRRGQMKKIHGN